MTYVAWWFSSYLGKMTRADFHLRVCALLEGGRLINGDVAKEIITRMQYPSITTTTMAINRTPLDTPPNNNNVTSATKNGKKRKRVDITPVKPMPNCENCGSMSEVTPSNECKITTNNHNDNFKRARRKIVMTSIQ